MVASLSTQAATGKIVIVDPSGRTGSTLISLAHGTYRYTLYEAWPCRSDARSYDQDASCGDKMTTYLEIRQNEPSLVVSAIGSIPFVGGVLASAILEALNQADDSLPPGMIQVNPKSALEAIVDGGSGIELRKSGSIIVHADEANRAKVVVSLPNGRVPRDNGTNVILAIPLELQAIVDEARTNSSRVIIILTDKFR